MQVPEKLSLIGGSILLASTLVFTLKSQASNILPKVNSGVSSLVNADKSGQSSSDSSQRQQDQQKQQKEQAFNNSFDGKFQQAQQKGWRTGQWGSAKFYVDDQANMYVSAGQLSGPFSKVVNDQQIKAINLDDKVQAPQDSSFLFSDSNISYIPLTQINGLPNLDTSQTTSMYSMFSNDSALSSLDLSHFDTSHVTNMYSMFDENHSLSNLDLSHFDTHNVNNMYMMFLDDSSLSNLNLSNFDTSNVNSMEDMFEGTSIHQLTFGANTKFYRNSNADVDLLGVYNSNGRSLSLDGDAHPGTWIRQ